jgi:uncharacterized protein
MPFYGNSMKYKEFVSKFKLQSCNLPKERQLSLTVWICKKLFFDYQEFADQNQWGDPDILLDAINLAEGSISKTADISKVNDLLAKIMEAAPDSEDFGNASYAINACSAVYETMEFLIDGNCEHIYNIGTCLTDTIDFKIQEEDELTEDQIDNHPLMMEARNYLIQSTR